jgi:hypothetical protein
MKNLIASLFLGFFFTVSGINSAIAESNPETEQSPEIAILPQMIFCGDTENILAMPLKYGEVPFAEMNGSILTPANQEIPVKITIYLNPKDWNYSFIADLGNGQSCLLNAGTSFSPAGPRTRT